MAVNIRRVNSVGDITQTLTVKEAKSSIKQALESRYLILDEMDNSLVFSQHEVQDTHSYRYINPVVGG